VQIRKMLLKYGFSVFCCNFFLVTTTQITTLNSVITTKIKFLDFKMSVKKKKLVF
jgi:hypothetical protein